MPQPTTSLHSTLDSPLGELLLLGDGRALHGLYMRGGHTAATLELSSSPAPAAFDAVARQLDEYFSGRRTKFDLPVTMAGTPFQRRVWRELQDIPYGQTISYRELARRIGRPSASRAVGRANGQNPISIIVPCHRVIGTNGAMTGYGGGVARKRMLLELEAR